MGSVVEHSWIQSPVQLKKKKVTHREYLKGDLFTSEYLAFSSGSFIQSLGSERKGLSVVLEVPQDYCDEIKSDKYMLLENLEQRCLACFTLGSENACRTHK